MTDVEIDPPGKIHTKAIVLALLSFATGMALSSVIAFAQYELGAGVLEVGFGLLAASLVVFGGAQLLDRRAPDTVSWSE